MNLGQSFLTYLKSLENSRTMLKSPSILLPFVLFAGLQCLVLFAITFYPATPLSSFMVPIVERLWGQPDRT